MTSAHDVSVFDVELLFYAESMLASRDSFLSLLFVIGFGGRTCANIFRPTHAKTPRWISSPDFVHVIVTLQT